MIPKLRLQLDPSHSWRLTDPAQFVMYVFNEAQQIAYARGAEVSSLVAIRNDSAIQSLVGAIGKVLLQAIQSAEIVPDNGTDLQSADVEVLERVYIAVGAELERRGIIPK